MATLEFQFDAQAITGVTDGATISTWDDTSGSNRDATQATASLRPVYRASGAEGYPVVDFSNRGAYMQTAAVTAINQPLTVFAVVSEFSIRRHPLYICDGLDSSHRMGISAFTTTSVAVLAGSSITLSNAADHPYRYPLCLFTAQMNGASSYLDRNGGALIVAGNAGSHSTTGVTLGQPYTLDAPSENGIAIGELRVYSGTMSSAAVAQVERELVRKWGLPYTTQTDASTYQIMLPPTPAPSYNAVLYMKGFGESTQPLTLNYEKAEVIDTFARAGFAIITPGDSQTYWGAGTDLDGAVNGIRELEQTYKIDKLVILAQSAGGIPAMLLFSQFGDYRIPSDVFVGIYPAFDLANMYANPLYTSSISTAYSGAPPDSHNPVLIDPSDWTDLHRKFVITTASYDDTAVPREDHSDVLKASIGPFVRDFTIHTAQGDHGHRSHFQAATMLDYVLGVLPTARRVDDPSWLE